MTITKYSEAIRDAIHESMLIDSSVVCFGLGVTDPKGVFNTTMSLEEEFGPKRVFDMPTSENAMTGIAIGASMNGIKPVMTHQRLDFFLLAMDQLVNSAAKWHYMFGGQKSVPITIRLIVGKGWGQGPTHSQSLQSWFAHIPGLKVVMPSLPSDAYNLLKDSIRDPNPVIFIEHRWLHGSEEKKITKEKNKIGQSKLLSEGKDFTVVTYSLSTLEMLTIKKALNKQNIFFDHVDLRTIKPLDMKIIKRSLNKTQKLLVLDTISHPICSIGSEIISQISQDKSIKLSKQPLLITLPDVPSPTSTFYTKDFYVSKKNILNKIELLLNRKINIHFNDNIKHDVPSLNFKGPF